MAYYYMDGNLVETDDGHNSGVRSLPINGTGCLLLGMDQDDGTCNFAEPPDSRGALNGSMKELRFAPPTRDNLPMSLLQLSTRTLLPAARIISPLAPRPSPLAPRHSTFNLQSYPPGSGITRGRKRRSKRIWTSNLMAPPPRSHSTSGLSTAFTTETILLGGTTSMTHA